MSRVTINVALRSYIAILHLSLKEVNKTDVTHYYFIIEFALNLGRINNLIKEIHDDRIFVNRQECFININTCTSIMWMYYLKGYKHFTLHLHVIVQK